MADDVLGVGVVGDLELEASDVVVAAKGPEVGLLDVQNTLELAHLENKFIDEIGFRIFNCNRHFYQPLPWQPLGTTPHQPDPTSTKSSVTCDLECLDDTFETSIFKRQS